MIEFIYSNIQWIFSGIGVSILAVIVGHFFQKKKLEGKGIIVNKSRDIKVKNNKNQDVSIDHSKRIDIEGNINDK